MLDQTSIPQENGEHRYVKRNGILVLNKRYRTKRYDRQPFKQKCPYCESNAIFYDMKFAKFVCRVCGEAWKNKRGRVDYGTSS